MGKQQSSFGDSRSQEPQRPFDGYADPTAPIHEHPQQQAQQERERVPVPLYLEGYRGPVDDFPHREMLGEKLVPAPGPSPFLKALKFIPPALILCLLLFMLAGGGNLFKQMVQAKNTTTQQLAADHPCNVVIHNARGRVHLHGSDNSPISVTSTRYNASWISRPGSEMNVDARVVDNGHTILIDTDRVGDNEHSDAQSVDLDVTVPTLINVQITAEHGAVKIDSITGNMSVEASDSINAQNVHSGDGHIAFYSRDGAIDVDQVDGQVAFTTNQGHIEVGDAHLTGPSHMRSQDGKIVFDGNVDPENEYSFESRGGAIDVSLPSNASFNLRVFADHSSVDNEFGSNVVGTGPRAHIGIATMSGNVEINEDN
ncbi:DUF4097 family beta strand repeat-containing protein [Dictyobacter aurantiacus]|uniref:DUF4097 domain-containing protein n=1 Tax=Dictyobacter aurantiacus TaxID=1936993 RepID=A0A401ZBK7_9CHLR|nr:DUF4097 family beta strand repeat-containing protein [Dictyobacter aurantiacus]GCE04274.1 hypothetical protein KDAU_16030 [Dictyobacter aurantiacus]